MDSGTLTVLQAIALAGGTSSTAKLSDARIIRKGPMGMSETPVHLKKMLSAKVPDMPMEADDILFVPTSTGKMIAGRTLQAALQAATAVKRGRDPALTVRLHAPRTQSSQEILQHIHVERCRAFAREMLENVSSSPLRPNASRFATSSARSVMVLANCAAFSGST